MRGRAGRARIQPLKAALGGDWMGHTLHPLFTDTVIGTWMSGPVLDLTGGQGADRLVAAGIVGAVPAALSGAADWADAEERDPAARRVGARHAVANVAALGLQIRSLSARGAAHADGASRCRSRPTGCSAPAATSEVTSATPWASASVGVARVPTNTRPGGVTPPS